MVPPVLEGTGGIFIVHKGGAMDFNEDEIVIVAQEQPDNRLRVQVNADNETMSITINFPAGHWPTLAEIREALHVA